MFGDSKVIQSVHFYVRVHHLLYQLNAHSQLVQTLNERLQHVSVALCC